jgi:hypothetical protein
VKAPIQNPEPDNRYHKKRQQYDLPVQITENVGCRSMPKDQGNFSEWT